MQLRVPRFIQRWNAGSILVQRLANAMPPGAEDPEEAPLEESDLFAALRSVGLSTVQISRGFELFHRTNPLTRAEKLCIGLVYAFFRRRGDVLAVLSQEPGIDPLR